MFYSQGEERGYGRRVIISIINIFDDEWKLEVEEKVLEYSKQNLKDLDLDKEIEESEIVRCINKL